MAVDQELIVGLLGFTHLILELLGEHADEAELVTVQVGGREVTYLDPTPLLQGRIRSGQILERPEIDAFLARLVAEQLLPTPVSESSPLREEKIRTALKVASFFDQFFRAHGSFEIDHVELVGRFDMALELWRLNRFPLHGIAPLPGFDSSEQVLDIGGGVSIRSFTPLAREHFAPAGWAPVWNEADSFRSCAFYLRYELHDASLSHGAELPEPVHRCVTALKLLHSGQVGTLFHRREVWDGGEFHRIEGPGGRHQVINGGTIQPGSYELKGEELQGLRAIFTSLDRLASGARSPLQTAVRRFVVSYHQVLPEDRLLDLSLVAQILQETGEFEELELLRSQLLTSSLSLEEILPNEDALDRLEESLRIALRRRLHADG
jgi:hypothetical protein